MDHGGLIDNTAMDHPELPGVASLRQTRTNPRIHGSDIVSKTNTIDTIVLISYLAGMNGVTYTTAECVV
jgi:hypothetical protein